MLILFSVLRFLHIVAGILWAGGAIALSLFIAPTMGAIGDAGKQFAGHLMGKTKFTMYMTVTAATTVLAGSILYGIDFIFRRVFPSVPKNQFKGRRQAVFYPKALVAFARRLPSGSPH